jgi:biotin transporter BioY
VLFQLFVVVEIVFHFGLLFYLQFIPFVSAEYVVAQVAALCCFRVASAGDLDYVEVRGMDGL